MQKGVLFIFLHSPSGLRCIADPVSEAYFSGWQKQNILLPHEACPLLALWLSIDKTHRLQLHSA
jgi:hypothetical protein